jgi:hypothetical protein
MYIVIIQHVSTFQAKTVEYQRFSVQRGLFVYLPQCQVNRRSTIKLLLFHCTLYDNWNQTQVINAQLTF